MQTVLLAGGLVSRLVGETVSILESMMEVGGCLIVARAVDDSVHLVQLPPTQMIRDREMMALRDEGFRHPMDAARDRNTLNFHCDEDTPPCLRFDREVPVGMPKIAIWER